jgi:hypothetical protein
MGNFEKKILTDDELLMVTGGTGGTGNIDWGSVPCNERKTIEECFKPGYECKWKRNLCYSKGSIPTIDIER